MVEELRGRVDLIGKVAVREFNKLRDELVPPIDIGWQMDPLGNDGLGMDAQARRLGATIRIDRHNNLADFWMPAKQLRDQGRTIGCALNENCDGLVRLAKPPNDVEQVTEFTAFAKLVQEVV